MKSSWKTWPTVMRAALGVEKWAAMQVEQPINIMTLCSGTDSPVFALKQLIQARNVRHVATYETSAAARTFIINNHCPEHLFGDVEELRGEPWATECFLHDGAACCIDSEGMDICVGGFPCKLFSTQNVQRFR